MRNFGWTPLLLALSLPTAGAAEQCQLAYYREIPVTMLDGRPTIPAEINGAHSLTVSGRSRIMPRLAAGAPRSGAMMPTREVRT